MPISWLRRIRSLPRVDPLLMTPVRLPRYPHAEARRRNADVEITLVLDLVPVREELWRAAYAFHPAGSDETAEAGRAWPVRSPEPDRCDACNSNIWRWP